ncbi:MAG: hypothetical protein FIA97_03075 [Methylococcaceae bacterium]|nr:hypothetical protein [Methylococcaceae bacterium]
MLDLAPMTAEDARQLASSMNCGLAPDQVQCVVILAEGIPLFIEELARWLAKRPLEDRSGPIPESLNDLLLSRIDQMDGARRIAQAGANLGRTFERHLLAAVVAEERAIWSAICQSCFIQASFRRTNKGSSSAMP